MGAYYNDKHLRISNILKQRKNNKTDLLSSDGVVIVSPLEIENNLSINNRSKSPSKAPEYSISPRSEFSPCSVSATNHVIDNMNFDDDHGLNFLMAKTTFNDQNGTR